MGDSRSISELIPGLEGLWSKTRGHPSVRIAVLDGPADRSHPALERAALTCLPTLVPCETVGGRASRHGTHVVSIIFGDGLVRGIAPACSGLLIPVFAADEVDGDIPCSQLELARALTLALDWGAQIVNVSGGQYEPSGQAEPILADAVRRCVGAGALIVAAAGNGGCDCRLVPASLPSTLGVAAMDDSGFPLKSSNRGGVYQTQAVLAPGVAIQGALPGGDVAVASGTSYSAAIVSGLVALILSWQRRRGDARDPIAIREAILATAAGRGSTPGFAGRFDLPAVLEYLRARRGGSMSSHDAVESHAHDDTVLGLGHAPNHLTEAAGITASDCSCGNRENLNRPGTCSCSPQAITPRPPSIVYALGQLGYSFPNQARHDSFVQSMGVNPLDRDRMIAHLRDNPWCAASLTWTLSLDGTPIYAIVPAGPYAAAGYDRLRDFLAAGEGVDRISVPGVSSGPVTLMNGQKVPVLLAELRGMFAWDTASLASHIVGDSPGEGAAATEHEAKNRGIRDFLDRVYYELRNLGMLPQDRALNYAATNAFQAAEVFTGAIRDGLKLDGIAVEKSPLGRPGADCWDVKLTFFDPSRRLERARLETRFTVDVSDVVPVTVGPIRRWHVY